MNDLFGDLPAAAGDDGTAASVKTAKNAAIALRPRVASTSLMPPPKRPVAARPPSSMAPPHARPRAVVAQAPIEIHAQNKQIAAAKAAMALAFEGGSSEFEELSCQGEAYDPARPNDYMEYCKERIEKKKQEDRDREYEKYKKERGEDTQRDQRHLPGGGVSFAGGQGQGAAPPARGRGRGSVSNLPSWMAKTAPGEGRESGGAAAMPPSLGSPEGRFEDAQGTPGLGFGGGGGGTGGGGGSGKEGIGAALLKKLGYKEGGGLGKDGQGITQAIQAHAIGGGKGVISGPPQGARGSQLPATRQQQEQQQQQQQQQQQKKKKRGLFSNPTKVVLLKNMVGPGQVDDDLQAETAEECGKHGTVAQCLIFEVVDDAFPEEERVRTFVAFERQESAVKAYVAMNGRFFGGRQVQASFFDEDRFARKDLAPREGE